MIPLLIHIIMDGVLPLQVRKSNLQKIYIHFNLFVFKLCV